MPFVLRLLHYHSTVGYSAVRKRDLRRKKHRNEASNAKPADICNGTEHHARQFRNANGKSKMRLLFSKFLSPQITYKNLHKDWYNYPVVARIIAPFSH